MAAFWKYSFPAFLKKLRKQTEELLILNWKYKHTPRRTVGRKQIFQIQQWTTKSYLHIVFVFPLFHHFLYSTCIKWTMQVLLSIKISTRSWTWAKSVVFVAHCMHVGVTLTIRNSLNPEQNFKCIVHSCRILRAVNLRNYNLIVVDSNTLRYCNERVGWRWAENFTDEIYQTNLPSLITKTEQR